MPVMAVAAFLIVAAAGAAPPPGRAAEVDAIFAEYDRPETPGCVVGVVQDGEIVLTKGYGLASLEWGIPNGARTVFNTASIAKQFTAAVVHLLAADGTLSLDDDVRKWIPELFDHGHRITLRQLIHHTSGMRTGVFGLVRLGDGEILTEGEVLSMYARQRGLQFTPGSAFAYNNTGYVLLALVVKRASGRSLRQVAAERIFGPLGMADTLFLDDHAEVVPRLATAYAPAGEGRFRVATEHSDLVGDGGLLTTVEDLARWQLNFENPRVGGPTLVKELLRPGVLSDGKPLQYASGLLLRPFADQPVVRHRGSSSHPSELMRFPDRRLDVICLCNDAAAKAWRLAERVAELWIGPEPDPAGGVVPDPEPVVAARAGLYRDPVNGVQVRVTTQEGKLFLGIPGTGAELIHLGGDQYLWPDRTWSARAVIDGKQFGWNPVLGRSGKLERFEPVRPSTAELRRIVGRYFSPELDVNWEIALDEGRPVLRIRGGPPRPLSPGAKGELVSQGIALRFAPGSGPARGFRVFTGTVHDLPFERVADRPAGPPRASPVSTPTATPRP
jgi:CubicO group peptidase (beta-lactamase class C family)